MSSQFANPPLLNLDVLEEVFLHLANDLRSDYDDWQPARQTLRDISLVSRQLTEPALRVLWRSMDTLLPLLPLLPQVQKKDAEYGLRGTFSANSWTRFDFYAGKIREYKYSAEEAITQRNLMVYACIARARGTFTLLPNLQSLLIDLRSDVSVRNLEYLLPLLAGRTLRVLEIWNRMPYYEDFDELSNVWNPNSDNLSTSLIALNSFCDIRNVTIHGDAPNDSLQSIASLESLRRLHFSLEWSDPNQPRPSFLKELAHCNQLLDIDIDLGWADYSQLDWYGYSALQRVFLKGDLISLINIVNVMETTTLSELDLHMECRYCFPNRSADDHPGAGTWWFGKNFKLESFMKKLVSKWAASMQTLNVQVTCNPLASSQSVDDILIKATKLIHLRSFGFAVIKLDSEPPPAHVDPRARRMNTSKVIQRLSALTQLKSLSLPRACMPSLKDVHYLVFHMPHLRKLRVSILLDDIPTYRSLPPLFHRLQTLDIDRSSPFPSGNLAQANILCWHLHQIFPELTSLNFQKSSSWSQVLDMLTSIRRIRSVLLEGGEPKAPLSLPPVWVERRTAAATGANSNGT